MYNCIIFDVDGTLIDTETAVLSSYQRVVFEEFGRHFTREELMRDYTVPTYERMSRFGVKNVEEAVEKYHAYLMEAFCHVGAYGGVLKMLDLLAGKIFSTGIVTARSRREVEEDPCLQSLITHFQYVVCADDTEKHKPGPEPILKLVKMANAEIGRTVYIGDTYSDYMCARNSGVRFGLALWGAKTTDGIHADYYFNSPEDILSVL